MNTPQALSVALTRAVSESMRDRRVSQRELADVTGIALVTLHRKLKGPTPFNVVELAAVAHALGTSLTDLALRAERSMGAAA